MSDVRTEIETKFSTTPGIDSRTIAKLNTIGIETLAQLKDRGWKDIANISNIGEKKLVTIFSQVGETLSEDEIIAYREDLKKHKVSGEPVSLAGTRTSIEPPTAPLDISDMPAVTAAVGVSPSTLASIETLKNGTVPVRMSDGRKTFIKFEITSDLEDFILKLINDVPKYLGKSDVKSSGQIENSIINSLPKLVPTGARAHVKQWMNLLESKTTGRRLTYSINTMNTPRQFEEQLEPLLQEIKKGVRNEIMNNSLIYAAKEIEHARLTKSRPNINKESIINTIILYKIYIDAAGSKWDEDATSGQLGVSSEDTTEFFRRMKDPASGGSVDFNDIAIRRAWSSYQSGQAILLAGMPGSGKTYFSKAIGEVMTDKVWGTLPFSRLNITGGLEPSDLIGEWDYQAQILAMSISKLRIADKAHLTKAETDALSNEIYTIDYFRFGPLALAMIQGIPILIDEVNRGSPDIQNTLLQAIDENELVIPTIGRIKASPGFFVMCTINEQDVGTTDLGAAFLRRVNYISFDEVTDYKKWVIQEFPDINTKLLADMDKIRLEIKKLGTVSSEIPPSSFSAWARELVNIYGPSAVLDKNKIVLTLGTLLKTKADIDEVTKNINDIITKAGILR